MAVMDDRELLARTIQAEAGNQGYDGKYHVGSVIRNRVDSGNYGDGYRGVIMKPGQFSAWNLATDYADGEQGQDMDNLHVDQESYDVADKIMSDRHLDSTGGATHYYEPTFSDPHWGARSGGIWTRRGDHLFGYGDEDIGSRSPSVIIDGRTSGKAETGGDYPAVRDSYGTGKAYEQAAPDSGSAWLAGIPRFDPEEYRRSQGYGYDESETVELPSGYRGIIPEGMTKEEALELAKVNLPEHFVERATPTEAQLVEDEDSGPIDMFLSGAARAAGGIIPGWASAFNIAAGDQEAFDKSTGWIGDVDEYSRSLAPDPTAWKDVEEAWDRSAGEGAAKLLEQGVEGVGQSFGFLAPALLAGAAVGLAGPALGIGGSALIALRAAAFAATQMGVYLSENIGRGVEEGSVSTEDYNAVNQILAAGGSAGADYLGAALIGGTRLLAPTFSKMGSSGVEQAASKSYKTFLDRIDDMGALPRIGGILMEEQAAEVAQTAIERGAAGLPISPYEKEARDEYIEIMKMTFAPTLIMGGIGGGVAKYNYRQKEKAEEGLVDAYTALSKKGQDAEGYSVTAGEAVIAANEDHRGRQLEADHAGAKAWEMFRDNIQNILGGNATVSTIHDLADERNIRWDNDAGFAQWTSRVLGKPIYHLDSIKEQDDLNRIAFELKNLPVQESKVSFNIGTDSDVMALAKSMKGKGRGHRKLGKGVGSFRKAIKNHLSNSGLLNTRRAEKRVVDETVEFYRRELLRLGLVRKNSKKNDNEYMLIATKPSEITAPISTDEYNAVINEARRTDKFPTFKRFKEITRDLGDEVFNRDFYNDTRDAAIARGDIEKTGNRYVPSEMRSQTQTKYVLSIDGEAITDPMDTEGEAFRAREEVSTQRAQENIRAGARGPLRDVAPPVEVRPVQVRRDDGDVASRYSYETTEEKQYVVRNKRTGEVVGVYDSKDAARAANKKSLLESQVTHVVTKDGVAQEAFGNPKAAGTFKEDRLDEAYEDAKTAWLNRYAIPNLGSGEVSGKSEDVADFGHVPIAQLKRAELAAKKARAAEAKKYRVRKSKNSYEVEKQDGFVVKGKVYGVDGKTSRRSREGFFATKEEADAKVTQLENNREAIDDTPISAFADVILPTLNSRRDENNQLTKKELLQRLIDDPFSVGQELYPIEPIPAPAAASDLMVELEDRFNKIFKEQYLSNIKVKLFKAGELVGRDGETSVDAAFDGYTSTIKLAMTPALEGMTADEAFAALSPLLTHERVHAFRKLGVFTSGEWKLLVNYANNRPIHPKQLAEMNDGKPDSEKWPSSTTYRGMARLVKGYQDQSKSDKWVEDDFDEEAVAFMLQDYSSDPSLIHGKPAAIMGKTGKILHKLRNVYRGLGFRTTEEIFDSFYGKQLNSAKAASKVGDIWWMDRHGVFRKDSKASSDYQWLIGEINANQHLLPESTLKKLRGAPGFKDYRAPIRVDTAQEAEDREETAPTPRMAIDRSVISDAANNLDTDTEVATRQLLDAARYALDRGQEPISPFRTPPKSENRVKTRLKRLRNPVAKRRGLPNQDFRKKAIKLGDGSTITVGKLSPKDWVKRVEAVVSQEEIEQFKNWYSEVRPTFEGMNLEGNFESWVASWLMAQQNESPSGAMRNLLRVREQVITDTKGVEGRKKGGLADKRLREFWAAIESGDPDAVYGIKGMSQKLLDFVDSALGKTTRTWMGNDPQGREPAVIDVHTARDIGFVDETFKKMLLESGASPRVVKSLKVDMKGAPSQAQYEYGVDFLHDVRDYLNENNIFGGNFERVAEVQALGWMSLLNQFGRPAGDTKSSFTLNEKNISAALQFGEGAPWNQKYGEFLNLDLDTQIRVTDSIINRALTEALSLAGRSPVLSTETGVGGYLGDVEASTQINLLASDETAADVANILGLLLQQTSVRTERVLWLRKDGTPHDSSNEWYIDLLDEGGSDLGSPASQIDLFEKIRNKTDVVEGFHPILVNGQSGIRIAIPMRDENGKTTRWNGKRGRNRLDSEILPFLDEVLADLDEGVEVGVHITPGRGEYHDNNWSESNDGQTYQARLRRIYGKGIGERLDSARGRIEEALGEVLEAERSREPGDGELGYDLGQGGRGVETDAGQRYAIDRGRSTNDVSRQEQRRREDVATETKAARGQEEVGTLPQRPEVGSEARSRHDEAQSRSAVETLGSRGLLDNEGIALPGDSEGSVVRVPDLHLGTKTSGETQRAVLKALGLSVRSGVDLSEDHKIYDLSSLGSTKEEILRSFERVFDKYGYEYAEFGPGTGPDGKAFYPDFRDVNTPTYEDGVAWGYNPEGDPSSFDDPVYSLAWRISHEIAHGIVNDRLTEEFGGRGRRAGAMGVEVKGPFFKGGDPLTLADALRAIEWEHEAFHEQRRILEEDLGIVISDNEFKKENSLNLGAAVYRALTGQFVDAEAHSVVPTSIDPYQLLSDSENLLRAISNQINGDTSSEISNEGSLLFDRHLYDRLGEYRSVDKRADRERGESPWELQRYAIERGVIDRTFNEESGKWNDSDWVSIGDSNNTEFLNKDRSYWPTPEELKTWLKDKELTDVHGNKVRRKDLANRARNYVGEEVAVRIDIDFFNKTEELAQKGEIPSAMFAVTVHRGKGGRKVLGYESIAHILPGKNGKVEFDVKSRAQKLLSGEVRSKDPHATINGTLGKFPPKSDPLANLPADIDQWTPVGYNPHRATYFYNKRTGVKVVSGTEAISIGNTVYVKEPQHDFSQKLVDNSAGNADLIQKLIDSDMGREGIGARYAVDRGGLAVATPAEISEYKKLMDEWGDKPTSKVPFETLRRIESLGEKVRGEYSTDRFGTVGDMLRAVPPKASPSAFELLMNERRKLPSERRRAAGAVARVGNWEELPRGTENWEQLPDGRIVGYRISRSVGGRAVSGADSRQSSSMDPGARVEFRGVGVFVTNDLEYAKTYYGAHDENAVQRIAFSRDDVTSGRLSDAEPEISIRSGEVIGSYVFTDPDSSPTPRTAAPVNTGRYAMDRTASYVTPEDVSRIGEVVLVHGTDADVSKGLRSGTESGALGNGIYFSADPDVAAGYGSQAIYASLKLKNPLVVNTLFGAQHRNAAVVLLEKLGINKDKAFDIVERDEEEYGYVKGNRIRSRATAQGYDGIVQFFDGKLGEVVAFNGKQVEVLTEGSVSQTADAPVNTGRYAIDRRDMSEDKKFRPIDMNTPADVPSKADLPSIHRNKDGSVNFNKQTWGWLKMDQGGRVRRKGKGIPVFVPFGFYAAKPGRTEVSGFGERKIVAKHKDLQMHTPFQNYGELLEEFMSAVKKNPLMEDGDIFPAYNEFTDNQTFFWDRADFKYPVIVVMTYHEAGSPMAFSPERFDVNTIYSADRFSDEALKKTKWSEPSHGPNVSTEAMAEFNRYRRPHAVAAWARKNASRSGPARFALNRGMESMAPAESSTIRNILGDQGAGSNTMIGAIVEAMSTRPTFDKIRMQFIDRYNHLKVLERGVVGKRGEKMRGMSIPEMAAMSAHSMALLVDRSGAFVENALKYGTVAFEQMGGEHSTGTHDGTVYVKKRKLKNQAKGILVYDPTTRKFENRDFSEDLYDESAENGGLINIVAPTGAKKLNNHLFAYLFALRTKNQLDKDPNFKTDMTEESMKEALSYPITHPEVAVVAANLQELNRDMVQFLVDTETINQEMADIWVQHNDYIPFYLNLDGKMTDEMKILFKSKMGSDADLTVLDSLVPQLPKRLKGGHTGPKMSPVESIISNMNALTTAGLKNLASRRSLRDAMLWDPEATYKQDYWSEGVITVRENGKPAYYKTNDILLHDTLVGVFDGRVPLVPGFMTAPARLLREAVTRMPDFILANTTRDAILTWINHGVSGSSDPLGRAVSNPVSAVSDSMTRLMQGILENRRGMDSDTTRGKMGRTGVMGGYELKDIGLEKLASNTQHTLDNSTDPSKWMKSLWKTLGEVSSVSEGVARERVYEKVEGTAKQRYIDMGMTEEKAAIHAMGEAGFQAMEVLNFSRRGASTALQILTAVIPFLNARIQGADVFARNGLFGDNALRADSNEAKKALIRRGMYIAGVTALYAMMMYDEEDLDKEPLHVREQNWIIPMPFGIPSLKIPIPFEAGIIFKSIPEHVVRLGMGESPKEALDAAVHAVTQTMKMDLIPQVFKPVIETSMNKNRFTDAPIIPFYMEGLSPEEQYRSSTSGAARFIEKIVPDWLPMFGKAANPLNIDHLLKGYFGSAATYALAATDPIIHSPLFGFSSKPEKSWVELPLIKRFAGDPYGRGVLEAYYDLRGDLASVVATLNAKKKPGGSRKEALEYQKKHAELLRLKPRILATSRQMKRLRDQIRVVENSNLSRGEKGQRVHNLRMQQMRLASQYPELKRKLGY